MSDETKIKGMGAIPHAGGVGFRVWAPHAERVSVIGSFNGWDSDKHPMQAEENGNWYARKRSTLAAAMVFTAPGIPMLCQGQEFLEG
jgi:1,4-alpha-glucan branching enzyme